jgi:hypothetical protein
LNSVKSSNLLAFVNEDYNEVDETITFLPSDTQKTLFVTIRQDTKIENDETFVLLLSTDADGVVVGDRTMTITIQDDDGKYEQYFLRLETDRETVKTTLRPPR